MDLRIRYRPLPWGSWQEVHSIVKLGPAPEFRAPFPQMVPAVEPSLVCQDVTACAVPSTLICSKPGSVELIRAMSNPPALKPTVVDAVLPPYGAPGVVPP